MAAIAFSESRIIAAKVRSGNIVRPEHAQLFIVTLSLVVESLNVLPMPCSGYHNRSVSVMMGTTNVWSPNDLHRHLAYLHRKFFPPVSGERQKERVKQDPGIAAFGIVSSNITGPPGL